MYRINHRRLAHMLTAALLFLAGAAAAQPAGLPPPRLERIAEFRHQVTGVAVAPAQGATDRRIFVNFPRWTEDTPVSVAEVTRDGRLVPYPNTQWNSWRNALRDTLAPGDRFVSVQSVTADAQGKLWVLDTGAPGMGAVVLGAPKLVRIDLATDTADFTVPFGPDIAPQGSYLNDVRISPDARYAYITDSGTSGALVVVHLPTGTARRVLDGHPSTQAERSVAIAIDRRDLRRPDGRGINLAAAGLALSRDGSHLYWQAMRGRTLYRIATDVLQRAVMQPGDGAASADIAAAVEQYGSNGVAEGLHIGRESGLLYIAAPLDSAIKVRNLAAGANGEPTTLIQDPRLRWPDSFAEGPDGAIYVTTSRFQDLSFFLPEAPSALPTQLWRLDFGSATPPRGR